MEEIWKDITGYEGYYKVSNLGRVKSLPRKVESKRDNVTHYFVRERILKEYSTNGYKRVKLKDEESRKAWRVHRLVAMMFIDNPESKSEVNHIDGSKTNNAASNLEWCTPYENRQHAIGMMKERFIK